MTVPYYRVLLHGQFNKRCRREIPADHPLARFAVTGMGLKLRIHPLAAALARAQLPRLDGYLAGRRAIAARMCAALDDVPGVYPPYVPASARPTWYALPLPYEPAELGGLPIRRFLDAWHAKGAVEADLPGSTCPLGTHPLFQHPGALLPGCADHHCSAAGELPVASTCTPPHSSCRSGTGGRCPPRRRLHRGHRQSRRPREGPAAVTPSPAEPRPSRVFDHGGQFSDAESTSLRGRKGHRTESALA
ncbi:DegT/DnrJ/EryC1/StrS family aminotransferase [Streptomyces sp. NPDC002215]|uniref:DegT/DnrJ/EryC1/StrS family aminotransferase n=1 Tax=Streptomyces sp. NPDC002215 TaxID=3154412 RepID=UPI0033171594